MSQTPGTEGAPPPEGDGAPEGFVVRDNRRIDPVTGKVRPTPPTTPPAPAPGVPDPDAPGDGASEADAFAQALAAELAAAVPDREAELTADLQRVTAEYANYRKRVERDRDAVRELAVSGALAELLPLLDDIDRARDHGELEGAFRSVGEGLEQTVARLGLEQYGTVGEEFDPAVHEALMHTESEAEGVLVTVVSAVYQRGYRFAGRVVRPARVGVADQPVDSAPSGDEQSSPAPDDTVEG